MGSAGVHEGGRVTTATTADLDRLCRMAAGLLDAPVAMVSLVGGDRQVHGGRAGLPAGEEVEAGALPHAFCGRLAAGDVPLVVDDAPGHPLAGGDPALGDLGVVAWAGAPVRDPDGNALGALCVLDTRPRAWTDAQLDRLEELAGFAAAVVELHGLRHGVPLRDHLTGLAERRLLLEFADRAMRSLERTGGETAVIAIGLDAFRLVNDAFGHAGGDAVLVAVANRLSAALRPGDVVCRIAGDEFAVLCERVDDEADALRIAERLLRVVDGEPYDVDGRPQPVTATLGIATTHEAMDPEALVLGALGAMAGVKAGSDDVLARVGVSRQTHTGARLRLRNEVERAQVRGELTLAYQPLERLGTGRMIGVEALMRWEHPDLGPIAPDAFIPAAEQSGAIVAMGEWALDTACADVAAWRRLRPGDDLHVAVNVAPLQIASPVFAERVTETLDRHGLPASALTLEITERTLLADRTAHRETLEQLRADGVRIALDDFGTGYSALGYLTRFELDELKLDKVFVDRLEADPQTVGIVEGILAMARALGLRTVAEGIERPEQRAILQRLGCDAGQGYLLGRPATPERITARLVPGRR